MQLFYQKLQIHSEDIGKMVCSLHNHKKKKFMDLILSHESGPILPAENMTILDVCVFLHLKK